MKVTLGQAAPGAHGDPDCHLPARALARTSSAQLLTFLFLLILLLSLSFLVAELIKLKGLKYPCNAAPYSQVVFMSLSLPSPQVTRSPRRARHHGWGDPAKEGQ